MKKVIELIILSILVIGLVGCDIKREENIANDIKVEDNNNNSVEILANSDSDSFDGMPITLKSKLKGSYNKDLQYHWILKNDDDIEGFILPEKGPQKEIINSGESVELGLFAEVSWIEGTVIEFKVILQVEDKETSNIIATDEIIIENHSGFYSIKD
ncbi:hypothetical protein [uncultured Clostridium sp.]|uniref:hypothetical protein n=1 Tax=uncultured Clostridium sp. TaxID=59620 RepID=UPI0025F87BD9|nr:hypothetical protein [uncultured Clostridium sp.]